MSIVNYDIAALILALNGISAVSASESIERLFDGFERSSVQVCGSGCVKRIGYIMASGDLQTDSYSFSPVYHDVELGESVVEGNIFGNKVSLCTRYFADTVISCAGYDLRENPPCSFKILFCFIYSLSDVFIVNLFDQIAVFGNKPYEAGKNVDNVFYSRITVNVIVINVSDNSRC